MSGFINLNFDFSNFFTTDFLYNYFIPGLLFSLEVTAVATVLGLLLGTCLALMRLSPHKFISAPATFYIVVMRSIPLLMVILWFFLLIPLFFPGSAIGGEKNAAFITFTVFEAAYFAEIMRAGIKSIAPGQRFAAMALGMNYWQNMRIVILPQAFRNMIPVLLTQIIILFQDTSLVYVISAFDLLKAFDLGGTTYGAREEGYILAALCYFIICFSLSLVVRNFQKRIAIIR